MKVTFNPIFQFYFERHHTDSLKIQNYVSQLIPYTESYTKLKGFVFSTVIYSIFLFVHNTISQTSQSLYCKVINTITTNALFKFFSVSPLNRVRISQVPILKSFSFPNNLGEFNRFYILC